jgi:type II secretory pathway component GspD/PulD (secretin)
MIVNKMNIKITIMIFLLSLMVGCADKGKLNRSRDQVRLDVGKLPLEVRNEEIGVFVVNSGIKIRHHSKSLLSVIDELAYRTGGSYTILSDISQLKISVFDVDKNGRKVQKRFKSEEDAILFLTKSVNEQLEKEKSPNRLATSLRSDGPEYSFVDSRTGTLVCYNSDNPITQTNKVNLADKDCSRMSFKKIFLQNTSSVDAIKSLSALFPSEIGTLPDSTRIIEYKEQNALIVRGQDKQIYDRIAKLLPALDAAFSQIVVETKVFQYTDSIDKQIGGLLNYSNGDVTISNPLVAGLGSKLSSISYLSNSAEARVSLLSQLALQDSDGLIRILAEPRLILQSGKLASVSLNTDKYFITPGVNVSGDIKPLPTGVTFEVTPTVLGDRRIKLSLKIIQSEFINNTETGVAAVINKNTIETTVVANDGELISLGGILTRKDTQQSSGMLGLRNIPVIGYLFSSEAEGSLVSRVEFFIRPTINRSHEKNEESVREAHDANCKLQVRVGGETCDDSNQDAKLEEIK